MTNTVASSKSPKNIQLPHNGTAPALGMGSWHLGQNRHPAPQEEEALRTGLSLGATLIDTAEVYGEGLSETLIGRVIAERRSDVFLVSKVSPYHTRNANEIRNACMQSLQRLGTDYLDLYLLHWLSGPRNFKIVVETFEALKQEGRIRHWGVSNLGVKDMEELFSVPGGKACAINQVSYSLSDRSIERNLLPWSEKHNVPLMAYTPLGNGKSLLRNPVLTQIAKKYAVAPSAVAIAWTMRNGATISIPESGSPDHMRENAAALNLVLDAQDLAQLDKEFPV